MKIVNFKSLPIVFIFLIISDFCISSNNKYHSLRKFYKHKNLSKIKGDNDITIKTDSPFFNFVIGFLEAISESDVKNTTKWYQCLPCQYQKKTDKKDSYIDSLKSNSNIFDSLKTGVKFINENMMGICETRKEVIDIIGAILSFDFQSIDNMLYEYFMESGNNQENDDDFYYFNSQFSFLENKNNRLPSGFTNIPYALKKILSIKIKTNVEKLEKRIKELIDSISEHLKKLGKIIYQWIGDDIITRIYNFIECFKSLREYGRTIKFNIQNGIAKIDYLKNAALYGPYQFIFALSDLLISMMCNPHDLSEALDFYESASTKKDNSHYFFLGKANGIIFKIFSSSEVLIPENILEKSKNIEFNKNSLINQEKYFDEANNTK